MIIMVKFLVTPSQSQTPETLLPQTAVLEPDTSNTDDIHCENEFICGALNGVIILHKDIIFRSFDK